MNDKRLAVVGSSAPNLHGWRVAATGAGGTGHASSGRVHIRFTKILKWAAGLLAALTVIVFALIGWQSTIRGTPVERVIAIGRDGAPPTVDDSSFARTMELFTGAHLDASNTVELMENGIGTYPRLWEDIRGAQKSLTVQMYYSQPGAVADTMQQYLLDRARHHVRVLLLMDAFGSGPLKKEREKWENPLRAAGVSVAWLRPMHWWNLNKTNFRSHVRVVVVDGRVGWTGGFGLADYWLGDGRHDEQWRESNARFQGPTVMELQGMFAAGWAESTGDLLAGDLFFPKTGWNPVGTTMAGMFYALPTTGSTNAERLMALSIASSRRSLYVTNSYFVPDDDFRRLLIDAAHRGVDVRILTAGEKGDVKTTIYAGRARYDQLLKEGVRIYEYQPTMIHAKTFVVDGMWSTVGSLNFDNRSLAFNNESNVLVLDRAFGAQMDQSFMNDLKFSREITRESRKSIGVKERLLEKGANVLSRVL
jgi:cardiolipin synthase A/B